MAVKMRLTRMGDKKSPFYRIVVIDSRKAQSGEYIDKIGYVNPLKTPAEVVIDADKAKDWLSKGVQPTETVKSYLVNAGVIEKSTKLSAPKTNDKKKKKD
ncbi:MAG: 30S ribosomal protein S16 [Clostridia bacterium]|nr:30S ribosomal protein S16 [Clostridia bacterium]MCD8309159.1 30S ribosomal protein S16 [Clostridia bacterium]